MIVQNNITLYRKNMFYDYVNYSVIYSQLNWIHLIITYYKEWCVVTWMSLKTIETNGGRLH